ncbi:MAG: enoyl-CoA hydratase/isomerase family protein [Myxococcota bacterium]
MSDDVVLKSREGGIVTLTMNRPARRNALSPDLIEALVEALERLRDDEEARVIVLTGAGDRAFCAGGDLGSQAGGGGFLALHEARGRFVDLVRGLIDVGKPTIARVNGACLGGGLGLMLACDLAVADRDASFGTPEIRVGLFPMMIMALIFRNVGRKKAMELLLTGERIGAEEAERIGLVNRVAEDGDLDGAVECLAERVASFSPAVLKLGRQAVYDTMDMPLDPALKHLHGQLTLNTMLEDAGVGVRAFLTKSKPEWKGK